MNAKQMLAKLDGYGGIIPFNSEELEVTLRALRLLAAAEANDGSTPVTDDQLIQGMFVDADLSRRFERERNGLAAKVGELERDAEAVNFYEREFYPLSNFSAFALDWRGIRFDTSEAAYHWEKFTCDGIRALIQFAPSAHAAFKIAESERPNRRPDWDAVKVGIMRDILRAKAEQHEYVRRKLLETGTRPLIEKSWRDDFWGWGPNKDGQNMLGKLWMEIRADLAAIDAARKP